MIHRKRPCAGLTRITTFTSTSNAQISNLSRITITHPSAPSFLYAKSRLSVLKEMDKSAARNPKVRTACDRCYELKERCQRTATSTTCARCERLGLSCLSIRPIRPVGRRPNRVKRKEAKMCRPGVEVWLENDSKLESDEKELLQILLERPENLSSYVVCPSFRSEQQRSFVALLPEALPALKDAFLACAITLKQLQSEHATDLNNSNAIRHISMAVMTLRSLPVHSVEDAALCHTLGSALALSIYSAIGVGVPDICRYCLGTTTPFMELATSDEGKDPWQNFLILLDTVDSLVHRREPTRRINLSSESVIDRHLGLSVSLLPYYYDLCVISNSLLKTTDVSVLARLNKQLDYTQATVEAWQPSCSDQLLEKFDAAEVIHLIAQAKAYRLGALLVSHRLQFPFGQGDDQARIWSSEMLMELELSQKFTKRSMRFVTLPFIVAAVEIQDVRRRTEVLQNANRFVDHYTPFMQKAINTFLSRVWCERDSGVTTRWFDSVHKPCPVLHSIDTSCFDST